MSILIVEANRIHARLLALMLQAQGCQTVVVWNGTEALAAVSETSDIQLIITDYMMQEMDGLEFIVKARNIVLDIPCVYPAGGRHPIQSLSWRSWRHDSPPIIPVQLRNRRYAQRVILDQELPRIDRKGIASQVAVNSWLAMCRDIRRHYGIDVSGLSHSERDSPSLRDLALSPSISPHSPRGTHFRVGCICFFAFEFDGRATRVCGTGPEERRGPACHHQRHFGLLKNRNVKDQAWDYRFPFASCGSRGGWSPYRSGAQEGVAPLLSVALEHQGHVKVCVINQAENDGDVVLRIDVTDQGIGIEPEKQNQLFQLFTQADGSITRKYGGTGLGLSICSQLVQPSL